MKTSKLEKTGKAVLGAPCESAAKRANFIVRIWYVNSANELRFTDSAPLGAQAANALVARYSWPGHGARAVVKIELGSYRHEMQDLGRVIFPHAMQCEKQGMECAA